MKMLALFFSLPLSAYNYLLGHSVANNLMFLALIRNLGANQLHKYVTSWSNMKINLNVVL